MMPGDNAPPLHPHCRCSTSAYEDNEEYEAWLDHLEKGGTTEEWNKSGKAAWQKQKILTKYGNHAKSKLSKIGIQFFASRDKQYGKKIGKHARDFGLDPSKPEDREKVKAIISDIIDNHDVVKIGFWRGQTEDVLFYIKGNDVVICKQNGEFVTVMGGGADNARVKNARNKKV